MASAADVRRIAAALPGVADETEGERLAFTAGGRQIAWTYLERVHPKTPRRPKPDVLAVRCPLARKALLVEAAPDRFFDDDHYRGYPALLVRLAIVEDDELRSLLDGALQVQVAKRRPR